MNWQGFDELLVLWLGGHRHTVLGRELQPFTLAHRELLRLVGHPFSQPGAEVSLPQLDLAVALCAVPGDQAGAFLRRKPRWWRSWWTALRLLFWARRWEAELEKFQAYHQACSNVPDVMLPVSEGEGRAVPDLPALLCTLTAEGHDMKEVFYQWPCGMADWMHLVLCSRQADVRFMTDEDLRVQAEICLRREKAEARRQQLEQEELEMPRAERLLRQVMLRHEDERMN